ncbi:MAG TPA: NifU family protein [Candidatus Acidoferrales bacterium]|nr:NifU family protein [Candidatus Acidoferrales bacterium]
MPKQKEVESQIESIDKMVRALEDAKDPVLRANAKDLVQALMALHGACLERMLEVVGHSAESGKSIIDTFARDGVVKSVLLLYGLHPVDVKTRVLEALEKMRPSMRLHAGTVSFVGIDQVGMVTLRMEGKSEGCGSSASALKQAVEQAIYDSAPDISGIIMEGFVEKASTIAGFVPLASLAATAQLAVPKSA